MGLHLCLWESLHSLLHGNCPGKYHDYDCDHNDDCAHVNDDCVICESYDDDCDDDKN